MSKTRTLNKTVTTILILLLTVSILSVINLNINMIEIPTVYGTNITKGTATLFYVNATHWSNSTAVYASNTPINHAIGNASSGCAIAVTPGTYNHSNTNFPITINVLNLTIASTEGKDNTIITTIQATAGDSICAFNITANNATIGSSGHGFTIKAGAAGTQATRDPAYAHVIDVYADYATIQGNKIMQTEGNTADIHVAHSYGTGHLIKNNTFRCVNVPEGWGIFAENLTSSVIEDNLWYGDNRTEGIEGAPGTCILINDASNVNITGNIAYYVKYSWLTFIAQYPRLDAANYMYEDCRNATITNVRVRNNTVHDVWNGYAICFKPGKKGGQPGGWTPAANLTIGSTVNIGSSNSFYDNKYGAYISANKTESASGKLGCVFSAGNLKINTNDIYNSTNYGVYNGQADTVNATYNWWGHVFGPSGVGHGTGDAVSAHVTYDPWLDATHLTGTAYSGLVLNYTQAPPNTFVNVTCASGAFANGESVNLYFAGDYKKTVTADANGVIWTNFTVPEKAAGTYTVMAWGPTTGSKTASFIIPQPSITLSPTRGSVGTSVTITGTNFNISDPKVEVLFSSTSVLNATSGATGSISGSFTVPSKSAATYTVNASDGINYDTATFTIPSLTIWLNVSSGPPSTPVDVTGEGFTKMGLVYLWFAGSDTYLKATSADSTGNITDTFNVPCKPHGSYTVKAYDGSNGTGSYAYTAFTIPQPSISLNVSSGPPAYTVQINGTNFKINAQITVKLDSATLTTSPSPINTNVNGTFTGASFVVSDNATGSYIVNASDGCNYATTPFNIPAPTITLNVTSGPAGTPVHVNGTYFKVGGTVNVTFGSNTTVLVSATPDVNGTFTLATFTVPAWATIGTYSVNATDGINTARQNFAVGCTISLNVTTGPPGTGVRVTGSGFTANGTVEIHFYSGSKVAEANATATGTLDVNFTVPDVTYGVHQVKAKDITAGTESPAVNFTVPQPTITFSSPDGQVGQSLTITGANFKLSGTITLWFAGTQWGSAFTATSAGGFSVTRTIPSELPGNITVTASDTVNNATNYFNLYGTGGIDTILDLLRHSTYGLEEIKNEIVQILANLTIMQADITTIKGYVQVINWTDITAIKGYVDDINWADITAIKGYVDDINWADITTILTKVTNIEDKLILAPSEAKFDFGTATSPWETGFIQVTPSTEYNSTMGYGWTNTTGLYAVDRGAPDYERRDLVYSSQNRTFKVDLPNGTYTVMVIMGDNGYSYHDNMTITVEGSSATVTTAPGQWVQKVFVVSVTDGNLTVTLKDLGGTDANWVINSLIIQRSWK